MATASHAVDVPAHPHAKGWAGLALSVGALGVVYGDIGTSPLYTVQLIFAGGRHGAHAVDTSTPRSR